MLSTSTNALGLALSYTWDALDRLTKVTFPDSTTVSNLYDKLDVVGRKDRSNNWTYATFDAMRQVTSVKDARGFTNFLTWCGCGSLATITDPLGHAVSYARGYDGAVTNVTYSADGFWWITSGTPWDR